MSKSTPPSPVVAPPDLSPSGRLDLPVSHGRLEALLKASERVERAVVVCHPHPKGGGTMNNNVVYRIARAMEASGAAVLRFNFRGVGRSSGEYGEGVDEAEDVRAALDFMAARYPGLPLWLAGFSFGARVGLPAGIADPRVSALLGVGLAIKMFDLGFLEQDRAGKPLAIVQAANDEYGAASDIEDLVRQVPEPRRLWIVDDATHLFPGRLEPLEIAVHEAIRWLLSPST